MAEAPRILLEHHLKKLKLPTFLREAYGLRALASPGELRRVMEHQDRAVAGGEPAPRRIEMAPENPLFVHPLVGEETIGRLRGGPVLAGQRDALAETDLHAFDQLAKATVQAAVAKLAARKFLVKPPSLHDPHLFAPDSVADKGSCADPLTQEIAATG